ncbi:tail fiber assembly protein [Salmonella enterica subsp. salamae]|uniref:Tail fiber assembly protein n=1 Tax=Salmonella enterica subsp. salamae serovar 55:k:z39 str. 1315K TaxID=1243602 RepID=A0A6C7C5S5_SALER|nr:hypothetical protein LFZ47_15305 [Salmonella enterica subsp. salamae serovar 55:k:z39 str. 1315K]ECC1483024.1 tail fiber assembly protein [Salmonella enterica subsp. salamae]EDH0693919.1 hypothetical protein [Salmonella enterica]ECC1657354.1 tail fiber assembly protein [Salmonella enterica subsp. salamae]ECC1694602.1 tail fiber assembly protein [Salmonella enterica subsp. salamae]
MPENITSVSPDSEYQKWDDKAWVKDEAAETAAQLAEWKKYRVLVNRVDVTNPDWLEKPACLNPQ